jgi:hypothetical protein
LKKKFFVGKPTVDIVLKTCIDKVGFLFNNTLFNVTSSGIGVEYTGVQATKTCLKCFVTSKVLYAVSPGLYSCSAGFLNQLSILYRNSSCYSFL